ncbi:hypothetical protein L1887_18573 [Cichorium endivia]|nr:hypothetical protein L1887_18573 [Cichorium endivia]
MTSIINYQLKDDNGLFLFVLWTVTGPTNQLLIYQCGLHFHHTSIDNVTTHGGHSSFPLFICLILKAFSLNSFNLIFKFNQAFSFPPFSLPVS